MRGSVPPFTGTPPPGGWVGPLLQKATLPPEGGGWVPPGKRLPPPPRGWVVPPSLPMIRFPSVE
jgi:hypothetical protein